ncbi:MAG: DUF6722 family protein [bacterium]
MQLDKKQKQRVANFITDIAKISIGGMVFGQFLQEKPFDWYVFFGGLFFAIVCVIIALILDKEEVKKE